MMRGMFAAISGLKNHQVMLDATANDISNVNTIGYKSARVTFQDSLNQVQRGASGPAGNNAGSNGAQIGLGVGLGSVDNLMSGGAIQTTGNPYDVAIQGEGFFQIGEGTPTAGALNLTPTAYTRAGNFSMSSEGFLTTQGGQYVLGFAARRRRQPDRHRVRDPGPDRRHRLRHRRVGRRVLRRPGHARPRHPVPSVARELRQQRRP